MSHKYDATKHTWSYETGELGYLEKARWRLPRAARVAIVLGVAAALVYVAYWSQ